MVFFENYLLYSVHEYKNLTDYDPYDDFWNGSDEGDTPMENGRIQKFLYGSDEGDTPSGNGKIEFFYKWSMYYCFRFARVYQGDAIPIESYAKTKYVYITANVHIGNAALQTLCHQ